MSDVRSGKRGRKGPEVRRYQGQHGEGEERPGVDPSAALESASGQAEELGDRRAVLPLDCLDEAPWNPKTPISGAYRSGLKGSLEHFGLRDDLKVWPNPAEPGRYFVLDGNQRLRLLREGSVAAVECRVLADLDGDDARLFTAAYDRNHAVYDEAQLSALAETLRGRAAAVKDRLLRPQWTPPAASRGEARDGEMTATQPESAVPVLFMLTREGHEEARRGILRVKGRMARQERLIAAVNALEGREADDLVVEVALRICDAARPSAEKTRQG